MQITHSQEKHVSTALFQFILPLSIKASKVQQAVECIQSHQFAPFQLKDIQKESAYYGSYRVSHKELEAFFLPITNTILFPKNTQAKGLQRYTKPLNLDAQLNLLHIQIPFQVHSADIWICPFELGFLTIRAEIKHLSFLQVQEFARSFRYLTSEQSITIECSGKSYTTVEDFIYSTVSPPLHPFLCKTSSSLFPPDKMFVQSLLSFQEEETTDSMKFDEFSFLYFTSEKESKNPTLISQYFGPYYYSVIIHLFHQLTLLKITKAYSEIDIEQAALEFEKLNYMINSFTSNYFFTVYPAQTIGQELFNQLRRTLQIEHLYTNMKEILFSLFKFEENIVTKRDSLLLLILTLYTVVCGIFSMNLFTHDLKGHIHWAHLKSYNPFEYFAVFIVFSGIVTVFFLGLQSLYQGLLKQKKRKKWVSENVLINKKR